MTDNHITLFCLVDGQPTSNAFPVEIESNKTIGHLKDLIKVKKTPRFDDIAAAELILSHVSHPVIAANRHQLVLLSAIESPRELVPTENIADVFTEPPPTQTIHILVQRPPPDLISELVFVRCVLDAIVGKQQEGSAGRGSTSSEYSLTASPRPWDILNFVRNMDLDSTPRYRRPRFMERRSFRPESELQQLFKYDLGCVSVLPPFAETIQVMSLRHGKPDLVCLKAGGDPDLAESVLFPIEIKRPVILRSENLVQDYLAQDQSGDTGGVLGPVNQIYGYMRLNGYRYGILSTYEQTWFMKRGNLGTNDLMISPAIAFDSREPTLLQYYLWFIREASNDPQPLDPPTDKAKAQMLKDERRNDKRRRDARSDKAKKRPLKAITSRVSKSSKTSGTVDRVTLPDFEEMELISHGERAQTYKARWQGRDVVLKKCDVWNEGSVAEELKNEAGVYQKLQTLQGRYIPKLLLAGVADGVEMVLVTEFVGTDVSQDLLDDSAQVKIQEAMSAIHELGVLHGDIRPENIVMQNHGSNAKFYFVDFGLSHFTEDTAELLEETENLNSLVRSMSSA
ncbi:hypothetical protein DFQ26_009654 [Actinomortierella ambigua]|nr:hypothetical protein DFQ26_009654 [Actinomortierella ambigua]